MGFTNIGNFGRKLSEFNNKQREKKLNNLKVKTVAAKLEDKKIKEELELRKDIEQHKILKKKLNEEKMKKFSKLGQRFEPKPNSKKKNTLNKFKNNSDKFKFKF